MEERRKTHRNRTYLGAQIAFNDRCSTIDGLVRNMSPRGARFEIAYPALVPNEFDLMIPRKGASRRARILWRRELDFGVAFIESEVVSFVPIEAARKIRRLETERDALVRRVSELSEPAI